ncbi:MAG TPA: hypothetical protein VE222_13080, partial [Nitrospiraceae bacterium]|nr:hypothetical protein [Nitrospiraceae bacterium]
VLAVGDSTPFLNQNVLYSSAFVLDVIAYLTEPQPRWTFSPWLVVVAGIVLGICVWRVLRVHWGGGVIYAALLGVSLIHPVLARGASADLWTSTDRSAVVSTAENNLLDVDPLAPKSPTALGLAMTRRDLTARLGDWATLAVRPRVIAILNPTRFPTAASWDRLVTWIKEGTTLIMAGDGDNEVFRALALRFNLAVRERPVGSLHGDAFTTFSAWEVSSTSEGAAPYVAEGFTVGERKAFGRGQVVILADGGFFLSKNLEMEETFDATNIAFVEQLLDTASSR